MQVINAILVDPFQGELYPLNIQPEPAELKKLLDCHWLEAVRLPELHGARHCAWIDESGLLREPFVYPRWFILPFWELAGYGLITCLDQAGEITSCRISITALHHLIRFEDWRRRIPLDDCIPQMMRIYDLA